MASGNTFDASPNPVTVKIVIAGGFGVGKTTTVGGGGGGDAPAAPPPPPRGHAPPAGGAPPPRGPHPLDERAEGGILTEPGRGFRPDHPRGARIGGHGQAI
jgi:hypothetical protein